MSLLTIPNNFVANTLIQSALMDANFTAISNWANGGVDNGNIGPAGLFASQILPLTAAEAQFGLTAVGVGYKFLANDTTAVPLTVSGVSGQSADLFDVTLTGGGTKVLSVDSIGRTTALAGAASSTPLTVTSAASASANTLVVNMGTTQSVAGLLVNGAASITGNVFQVDLTPGGTHAFQIHSAGAVTIGPAINAGVVSPGDLTVARSASAAAILWGTSATTGAIQDWGLNTGGQFSFKTTAGAFCALNASAFTVNSDVSAKENVQKTAYGLATLMALKPSSYALKSDGLQTLGFVAQDVLPIVPEAVQADNKGILGVSIMPLLSVHTAAIQELAAEFAAYKAAHP